MGKGRTGRVWSRRSCHSAGTRAFAVSVADRYGDKPGQPPACPGTAMASVISWRCSHKVRVGKWGFPGGEPWERVGYLCGTRDAASALASASCPEVLLLLVWLYSLFGFIWLSRGVLTAAVVWKGQVRVAQLSWYVHRVHLSTRPRAALLQPCYLQCLW